MGGAQHLTLDFPRGIEAYARILLDFGGVGKQGFFLEGAAATYAVNIFRGGAGGNLTLGFLGVGRAIRIPPSRNLTPLGPPIRELSMDLLVCVASRTNPGGGEGGRRRHRVLIFSAFPNL